MAILVNKLTQVIYVGVGSLTLSTLPTSAKSGIKYIRQVNPGGTGYAAFNPLVGVNGLTTAYAPSGTVMGQFIVETVSSTPNIDLGADFVLAVAASPNVVRLVAHFAAGQTNLLFPLKITGAEQVGRYNVDLNSQPVGVTNISYSIAGTAVSLPTPILNVGDTLTIVGSTQTVGEGYLTLIKQ